MGCDSHRLVLFSSFGEVFEQDAGGEGLEQYKFIMKGDFALLGPFVKLVSWYCIVFAVLFFPTSSM